MFNLNVTPGFGHTTYPPATKESTDNLVMSLLLNLTYKIYVRLEKVI